ncbi:ABC transporter ATP-binding protein [Merdimonas faecis]|uniref:ABC transporter ATP-binding protein n=1 Tax=Merdimonas faecis TaxID=1653435 RepID=A0A9D2VW04_9FIRM|nr:ABC transporter ATP-binding protein [Merdimonas faecis]HJH48743.1 ABC transporter ATP-binding protein [Merdimonas faecis]
MNPILECRNLSKKYGNHFFALNDLTLSLDSGQIVGLLGPNGSGKTTLIKLINGLLNPSSGEVLIDGKAPGVDTKKIVSYLPERTYLDESMKVRDIIRFFADFYDNFITDRAYQMLSDLEISADARLRTLSKGTKEKVQLILVMSRDAKLYILDEPIGGVDPAARDYILHTILANYNEESTILLSTHLIHDIENILDRVVFLKEGRLAMNAPVDDIRMEQGRSVDTLFREVFRC